MRNTSPLFVLAVAVVLILSPGVAFRIAYFYDSEALWSGLKAVLLEESDGEVSAKEFRENLQEYSRSTGDTVTIEHYSPEYPGGERHFFTTGQQEVDHVGSFLRGKTTVLHPMTSLESGEARFTYTISSANPEASMNFLSWANDQGYAGQILQNFWADFLIQDSGFVLFLLLVLSVFVAAAAHSITRSRSIGVHRMLGKSAWQHFLSDLQQTAKVLGGGTAAVVLIILVTLTLYNGFTSVGPFLIACVLLVLVGLLIGITGYFAGYAVATTAGIVGGIRGASPTRLLIDVVALERS